MPQTWTRPTEIRIPTVWSRFSGLKPMPDGQIPNFWIQDVAEEDDEAILTIMERHFIKDEDMSRIVGIADDPTSLQDVKTLWVKCLHQRMSLAVWTDWPNGDARIIGCNILSVATKDEDKFQPVGAATQKVFRALTAVTEMVDSFKMFGVTEYLSGLGLSVMPEFRGQNIGVEVLKARTPLCRAFGIRVTTTVFTGAASQKQAARAGFFDLAELPFAVYKEDGRVVFEGTSAKGLKLKAKHFEE